MKLQRLLFVLPLVVAGYASVLLLPGVAWANPGYGLGCGGSSTLIAAPPPVCVYDVSTFSVTFPPPCTFINGGNGAPQQGQWQNAVSVQPRGQTVQHSPCGSGVCCTYTLMERVTVAFGQTAVGTYVFSDTRGSCTVTVTLPCTEEQEEPEPEG